MPYKKYDILSLCHWQNVRVANLFVCRLAFFLTWGECADNLAVLHVDGHAASFALIFEH